MFGGSYFGSIAPGQVLSAGKLVSGAVTQSYSLGISTAGGQITGSRKSGAVSQTYTLGLYTGGGQRTARSSISQSYNLSFSTSGHREGRSVFGSVSQSYLFGASTTGKPTYKSSVSQSYLLGMQTVGRLRVQGSVSMWIHLLISTGEYPIWFRPDTVDSWKHLLRESKDPGGEVNVGTNRWLAGPAPKRRPAGTGAPSGKSS